MAPRKLLSLTAALSSATSAWGQDCAEASYAWCPDRPFYFRTDELPVVDGSACCGGQIIGDPTVDNSGRTCLCDVTAGVCDAGCCCDLDCSSDSLRYDGVFGCTSNGTTTATSGFTTCSENLVSTNIPQYAQEQGLATAFGGADGLLCVFSDNSPARGAFFRDPVSNAALTPQEVLAELDAAKPLQYGTSWLASTAGIPPVTYATDAPLLGDGCLAAGDAAGCARLAPMLLPAPGPTGECSSQQQLGYLRDVPPFTCPLLPPATAASAAALRTLCATTLNASALNAATVLTAPTPSADASAVGLSVAYTVNGTTGGFGAADALPASHFDEGLRGGTCVNALVSYQLRVVPSGAGTVSSARAYATMQDVSVGDLPTARATYAAAFEYAAAEGVAVRPTSGRPGYIRGLPLLIKEGDVLRTDGLRLLPRTPSGACASSPSHSGATPVRFGEDLAVSCTRTLSAAALAAFCTAGTPLEEQLPYASLNLTSESKIGMFGDAHPSAASDWVPLTVRSPSNDAVLPTTWNAATQTCENVLTGLHLRILTSDVGRVAVPVTKVVGAELLLTSRSVSAARGVLGAPLDTTLTITATTTFAALDGESYEYVPEAPQIIPPLPYDFFYPFTTSY